MLTTILLVIILLWVLGYVDFPGIVIKDITLFSFNGRVITLWEVLLFFAFVWAIGILPRPYQEIVLALFFLWILSIFGIIIIAGFSKLLVVAIIVGLVFAITRSF
ncbi:hypothetical protein A2Y99_02635 [Candidatus Gottesmanbacteria bacterium RBG_13_37_7]|uniref:Uncharacterized protein n=1 Tax=Candidatus Gottesmanbacteria bacterium RBG_13_37_7 TaxID=1798369 RepID=A0A1F5YG31_9BACT|nr:MAG: hypothetical protein A2Y99_02635 [Candidatus Gottesmanbacteria bacterium RBG_13_37_7]